MNKFILYCEKFTPMILIAPNFLGAIFTHIFEGTRMLESSYSWKNLFTRVKRLVTYLHWKTLFNSAEFL